MVADEVDFVVGVDTHLEEHVPAVVSRQRGLARLSVWENARGYSGACSRRRSRRLPGQASGRERRSSTRSPTGRGVKRVHGGGSGRNLVELLRGGRLRLEGRQLLTTTASDAVGAPVAVAGQIPVEAGVSLAEPTLVPRGRIFDERTCRL